MTDLQLILSVVLGCSMEKGEFKRLSDQDEEQLIEYVVKLNYKVFNRKIQMLRDAGLLPEEEASP